ncbi:hypothetical protein ACFVWR_06980 [Leifsonia sp. NPDC058292]|uniref:hypothetical protein n=1 Tax=Leifsonia sp. NPDC058292 TaxID=3346428 RepID=UPI0036DBD80A
MDGERTGEEPTDPTASADAEEAPLLRIARSELRTGKWLLLVGIATTIVSLAIVIFAILRPHSVFDTLVVVAVSAGGTMLVLGAQKFRNGRATLRDEIRRQAEHRQQ